MSKRHTIERTQQTPTAKGLVNFIQFLQPCERGNYEAHGPKPSSCMRRSFYPRRSSTTNSTFTDVRTPIMRQRWPNTSGATPDGCSTTQSEMLQVGSDEGHSPYRFSRLLLQRLLAERSRVCRHPPHCEPCFASKEIQPVQTLISLRLMNRLSYSPHLVTRARGTSIL